jgi:hypothetical protein
MRRLRNTTDIPDWLVKSVEEFVMPPGGVGAYDIELRNSGGRFAGAAYHKGSGYHTTARPFIVLRVGSGFPCGPRIKFRPGYLPTPALASKVEAMVYVYAHELRHLWQARVKKGRRVWGARGQFSERDADAWGIHCLRRWRREKPTTWNHP